MNFIEPRLKKDRSPKELLDAEKEYLLSIIGEEFKFTDIFACKRSFVIGEPGYGKTRLLKEIVLRSENFEKKAIFLDLKHVDKDLAEYIKVNTVSAENTEGIQSEEDLLRTNGLKTPSFSLQNSTDCVVCLDGLDEVKSENFSKIVNNLTLFCSQHPRCNIYISCRRHHFKKYQRLFTNMETEYILTLGFSEEQAEKYLKTYNFAAKDIEKLEKTLTFPNRQLITRVPRYISMLGTLAQEYGIDYVLDLNRAQLFEKFIYRKLEIEEEKVGRKEKELIKRVLEKLALVMEIYQTNTISREELITFFDDIKSNISFVFLQQVPLEILFDRSLIKDNIDTIEFENTEFQEYLAAKEISRLGKTDQIVFDLAVDQDVREVMPSWFNTLGFLIDIDISLLKPLLDLGKDNQGKVQDEEFHKLITRINVERLPNDQRKQIFEEVFLYYQNALSWIDFDIAENLSLYYDESQEYILKESIDGRKNRGTSQYVKRCNTVRLLNSLLKNERIQRNSTFWKRNFIKFIKQKENNVIQRYSLLALSKFQDISFIKNVYKYLILTEKDVLDVLMIVCKDIDPNCDFSIEMFIEGTKKQSLFARYGLYEVTEEKGIVQYLDSMIKDPGFLSAFIYYESIFKEQESILISNIRKSFSTNIYEKLLHLILHVFETYEYYDARSSNFLVEVLNTLKEKKSNFLQDLICTIKDSMDLRSKVRNFDDIFSKIIEKNQVKEFVESLCDFEEGKETALGTLISMSYSQRDNSSEVYEEGRQYFDEDYKKYEQKRKQQKRLNQNQEDYRDKLFKKFQYKLEPEKDKYVDDVFRFYVRHAQELEGKVTSIEIDILKRLLNDVIFEKIDPLNTELHFKKGSGGSTYTTSRSISIFADCLEVTKLLSLRISKPKYRQHILNYIPFAYPDHLSIIFDLISNPSAVELEPILKVYTGKRKDDLPRFRPDSLIKSCENYKISSGIPVLKIFVEDAELPVYERNLALEAIEHLQPNKEYLQSIFQRFSSNDEEVKKLAVTANDFLIINFKSLDMIKWRFSEIKNKAFTFVEITDPHGVGSEEEELHHKTFAKPLLELNSASYRDLYLDLLQFSFDLIKKEKKYWSYTTYIWDIVCTYFDNLKSERSYEHLKELERFIQIHSSEEGVNWFSYRLLKLKRSYISYLGKPQNISNCIKRYNQVKARQYLEITSTTDLINTLKKAIDIDLRRFVESEGFYKTIRYVKGKQEDLIQKTMKTQLEISLIRRGLRENEVCIRREEQLLDDKRTDFLISYGFVGPILIEVKRVSNEEIHNEKKRTKYKDILLQYIEGTGSKYGIFLLFQTDNTYTIEDYLPKLQELYSACQKIEILSLNCCI